MADRADGSWGPRSATSSAERGVSTPPTAWRLVGTTGGSSPAAPSAGSGAAAVQRRDDRIDVRDAPFLAVGDGQADDTNAIQAALDLAATRLATGEGAWIWLPRGQYRVTRPLVLRGDQETGIVLEGEPGGHGPLPGARILYHGPEGEPLLDLVGCSRIRMQAVSFDGDHRADPCVRLMPNGVDHVFTECTFLHPRQVVSASCVAAGRADPTSGHLHDLRFIRCRFVSSGTAYGRCFVAHHPTNVMRLHFDGCRFEQCSRAVELVHNGGVLLRQCTFFGGGDYAITLHDTQLVAEGCTFHTPRVISLNYGSATLTACYWTPNALPEDGQFIWCNGRILLLGTDFLNQTGQRADLFIGVGQYATVFSRGSRYTDAGALPVRYYGQRVGGVEGTDDVYKGQTAWDWGRGPCIDAAGDISVSYTEPWRALPSVVDPVPHLIRASLPIQRDQVSAGHAVLSEGQLTRQVAKFRVPASVWTGAATAQIHTLARPFHRTRLVGAWIDVLTPLTGVAGPRVSLGLEGVGDCDTLLRAAPADAVGLIGASVQDLGRGLDPETAVQGGLLVGWTPGAQERLALRLTAAGALGDGAATLLSGGELEVIVMFEVIP